MSHEIFKKYTKQQIKEIETNWIGIENNSWYRYLLNLLPDYSSIKFCFANRKGGLGYVAPFDIDGDRFKHEGIRFTGIPTPEIWTHEIWHYFTIPALTSYKKSMFNKNSNEFVTEISNLYQLAKSKGYSTINGVSIHENLNEFIVNITNINSVNDLKKIGLFDQYLDCQKKWLDSIK